MLVIIIIIMHQLKVHQGLIIMMYCRYCIVRIHKTRFCVRHEVSRSIAVVALLGGAARPGYVG